LDAAENSKTRRAAGVKVIAGSYELRKTNDEKNLQPGPPRRGELGVGSEWQVKQTNPACSYSSSFSFSLKKKGTIEDEKEDEYENDPPKPALS
jgi:hypothetical protein